MAENENGQEKTEEATPRKLEKAKDEGQIPRSKELNTAFVLIGGVSGLIMLGDDIGKALMGIMRFNFTLSREVIFSDDMMIEQLGQSTMSALDALVPFFTLLAVAAIIGPIALGGWLFSAKAMAPKFSRMNPLKGLKRMFSANSLVELFKAMCKFALVASIAVTILVHFKAELLGIGTAALRPAVAQALELLSWSVLAISSSMIILAIMDVPYQIFDHGKKLKMTLQEVKDEMKDTEGKPEVKGRIRQLQREMANRRMMEAVPDADVVITNPEHFSVALKYDIEGTGAPTVLAKGGDFMAIKIREIAKAHDVMIMRSPTLARAVYFSTEVDQEIPAKLYLAVAQVLAYVFQLKAYHKGQGKRPDTPGSIDVPLDSQFDSEGKPIYRA